MLFSFHYVIFAWNYRQKYTLIYILHMRYISLLILMLVSMTGMSQTMPSLRPEVTYTNPEGTVLTGSYPDDLQLTEI